MIFQKLKIKYKLLIVAISQVVIVVLMLGFIFNLSYRLNNNVDNILSTNSKISQVRDITLDVKDFFTGGHEFTKLNEDYNILLNNLKDYENLENLKAIWPEVEKYEKLSNENENIISEVMSLADNSVEQSNGFLKDVSQRLANPGTQGSVTTLERLVIEGATVNTTVNFQIKVLFYQIISDFDRKTELLNFLDKAIENSSTDAKSLANTPFVQLPLNSIKNDKRIKELALTYISNIEKSHEIHDKVKNDISEFITQLNNDNIQTIENNNQILKGYIYMLFLVLLLISIFIIIINVVVSNSVTKAFLNFTKNFEELAKGNLITHYDESTLQRKDELGDLERARLKMLEKLKNVINEVKTGTNAIAAAGKQLSTSAQQLSQGSAQQASSAEEISASMEQMAANISQNNENAKETKIVSVNASMQMQHLSSSANESLNSIDKISEKISIINDIAFQTNILALNAAVEAARAGDMGKGFAVVASEVRKLAERSKLSANEIENLSQSSVKVTHETKKLLNELLPDIEKTTNLVQEIANASVEQDSGVSQVNKAITTLNDISQQNAGISEELASSAEELAAGALELERTISYFKTEEAEFQYKIKKEHVTGTKKPEITKHKETRTVEKKVVQPPKEKKGIMIDLGKDDLKDTEFESF